MDLHEFQKKDIALKEKIAAYRDHSAELNMTIAANEREIIRLEWQRTELQYEYASSSNE